MANFHNAGNKGLYNNKIVTGIGCGDIRKKWKDLKRSWKKKKKKQLENKMGEIMYLKYVNNKYVKK